MSAKEVRTANPQTMLSRLLSTQTEISIDSGLAHEDEDPLQNTELRNCKNIGSGQCGTVFVFIGTNEVIKTPNGASKEDVLYQDARVHARGDEAFREAPLQLRRDIAVPQFRLWIQPKTYQWWDMRKDLFPPEHPTPSYGLVSERIFPLPRSVRQAIIDSFCLKSLRASVQANPENKDCLVRLYLGKRGPGKRQQEKTFRLRNFPLLVNDLEVLKIDTTRIAEIMADALAILHWSANVDGNDVEFVIGSQPSTTRPVGPIEFQHLTKDAPEHSEGVYNFTRCCLHVWPLDFNQCTRFEATEPSEKWLALLTKAFWFNDPYFPRPVSDNRADKALWRAFAERYIFASSRLTDSTAPAEFIKATEDEGTKRREKLAKQGKDSLFGALVG